MGTPDELKLKLPEEIPLRELVVHPLSNLKKPDIFFYDNGLLCTLAYQKKKAPLVFLITTVAPALAALQAADVERP